MDFIMHAFNVHILLIAFFMSVSRDVCNITIISVITSISQLYYYLTIESMKTKYAI